MVDAAVICANRQCRVAQDGKCLEGYEELGKCPYYDREPDAGEADAETDEGAAHVERVFDGTVLGDALALDTACANRVMALLPTRFLAVIGAYDSGKSSVIAGLYDLFQMGPVSNVAFAGSSTLHGLELICHDARVASERDVAHSERTKRGEVRFYHIDVDHAGELKSLLIADRSGEEYEEVADLAANAAVMFELRRADVVTILVDGRRLASSADRADTMGAIQGIIQGMVENGAFARRPNLAIVLTKDDDVRKALKRDRVMRDFQAIVDGIREGYGDSFGELGQFVTSASPKDPEAERGQGLPALLEFWLAPSSPPRGTRLNFRSGRVFDGLRVEEADLA